MAKVEQLPEDSPDFNDVWRQFMTQRRDWRQLVTLVQDGQIQPEYQHRAIEVLLTPDVRSLEFPVNLVAGVNTYTHVADKWVENVTEVQASFIAKKIPEYIRQAGQILLKNKDYIEAREALFAYNGLIPHMLGKLPQEEAEKLFESFNINDPLSFWNMDNASGYNPLVSLYSDRTVDESWKRKAAREMHDVIEQEQKAEAHPRATYEEAVENYSHALVYILEKKDGLPISREFYQDEIAFMLGVKTGRPIVNQSYTWQVFELLDDEELRYSFIRRQVLTDEPDGVRSFKVFSDRDAEIARKIISEFPEDRELRPYLADQLAKWEVLSGQRRKQHEHEVRIQEDILSNMKRPPTSS